MTGRIKILVVDDELIVRESLIGWLRKSGYEVAGADGGRQALAILAENDYDLVFLDFKMPEMSGIEVLEQIKANYPQTMVVMITAYGSIQIAVEAMKLGAHDYLMKPFEPEGLALLVEKLLNQKKLLDENLLLREQVQTRVRCDDLIGASKCMCQLFGLIEEVAKVESPILIRGETGTGKELVAKAIHSRSTRCFGPFIPINCGAFTETLLEGELFGHESGAFTGAVRARKGRIEMAHEGTLFLDEIGEIPLKMQVDLLRVLEQRALHRVGGTKEVRVDFRLISATHRDLLNEIERGNFRQDFYYRLNVIEIEVPPLRQRDEDVPVLAQHFMERFRRETNKPILGIQQQALDLLVTYDWPGNVRELENAIERAVVLARGRYLTRDDFAFLFRSPTTPVVPQSLKENERQHIDRILKLCGWNISKAANVLEISRITLHSKIKKYVLQPSTK
ncbi:MAG: sigma-54 dependent transcriptional regulator [Syntrophobacteraceae bacterium]|jgi:two-component system response regulator HydG|nr:sigma-54 dependent transcriptional regulator [Syntrophobacteraceae bacterium]